MSNCPGWLDDPPNKWPWTLLDEQFAEDATDGWKKGYVLMRVHDSRLMADEVEEAMVLGSQLGCDFARPNSAGAYASYEPAQRPKTAVRIDQAGHTVRR